MEKANEILTDEQINKAWGNAQFGENVSKREVVENALLKYASGYYTGHTIECICIELNLIDSKCKLTNRGRAYLYAAYSKDISV